MLKVIKRVVVINVQENEDKYRVWDKMVNLPSTKSEISLEDLPFVPTLNKIDLESIEEALEQGVKSFALITYELHDYVSRWEENDYLKTLKVIGSQWKSLD